MMGSGPTFFFTTASCGTAYTLSFSVVVFVGLGKIFRSNLGDIGLSIGIDLDLRKRPIDSISISVFLFTALSLVIGEF